MAKIGFVSESGSHGFGIGSFEDTHFFITAVLVEEGKRREIEGEFLRLREHCFPDGNLPAYDSEKGQASRKRLFKGLQTLEFSFHSLLVDKRKLHQKSPLQYKGTFYKFLSGLIYNNLYRTIPNLSIVANELGTPEFMESFRRYVQENHQVDLFSPAIFTFSNGEDSALLQLADILGKELNAFQAGKSNMDPQKELAGKCVGVERWPEQYTPYTVDASLGEDPYAETITEAALLRARNYIQQHAGSEDPILRSRVAFVEYLLMVFTYNYRTRYIHTHELLQHLNSFKYETFTEHRFRSTVVGPVRDEGVLIVSSSAGYKLPCCSKDIYGFFNYYNQQIQPMLHRLNQCRRAMELATGGDLNILEQPAYTNLQRLLLHMKI
ncbi:hypothetical protein [Rufibacter sp. XAAS-G3-1]|uniref:hypothetical protein n=1 Tax=Rufibacter sp. XAAS-G3-1 TaxID=2729134 RepID=UPI0015E6A409|nr:hypothetical protein [Rufibacter sp. XAAS-G3-1]